MKTAPALGGVLNIEHHFENHLVVDAPPSRATSRSCSAVAASRSQRREVGTGGSKISYLVERALGSLDRSAHQLAFGASSTFVELS